MESFTLIKQLSSLENKKNCMLCFRKAGIESKLLTNQPQFNLHDICNIYLLYLKPKLSKTLPSFDWSSLEAKNINTSPEFCSSCFSAGQKLLTMNERLKTIQSEIECFIGILSEEIIKLRRLTNVFRGADYFSPENIYSNDTRSGGGHFLCESIKEEPEVKQEIENEYINLLAVEAENLYFSDNSSTHENQLNQQDSYPSKDEQCSQQGNIDLNNMNLKNSKTSILNAIPPTYEGIMGNKVVSRKSIENRQLVICLERLPITPGIKKTIKSNWKSKMRSRKQKDLYHSDPTSSVPKHKALGKTPNKLLQREAMSDLDKEMTMDAYSDSVLDADIKQRRIFNKQRVIKKVKDKAKRKDGNCHFECTPCGMEFFDSQMYILHMEALHGDDPVKCRKCGEQFVRHQWLRRHMEIAHPTILKCENCPNLSEFKDIYEYEIHLMSHTGEIPYECHECHEKFSNPRTYCEHQKTSPCAIRLGKFKCDSCDELFAAKCFLLMHIAAGHTTPKKNSDGRFECDMCDNIFYKLFDFESHYSKHTDEYIYSCDICGRGHRSLGIFISHRKTHLTECQAYICQFCGKQFKLNNYLQAHIKVMHVEENVTCEKCGNTFKNPRKFKIHLRLCGNFFSCEICGKKIKRLYSLQKHMILHTNEGLKCQVCYKAFTTKAGLKKHTENIHLNKRDLVCEFCGKAFYSQMSYNQHLRNHREEKPFECQICAEKFKYDSQLSDHNRLVHDAPLLQCKHCEEQFKTYSEKYYHFKTAHQDLQKGPFKCSVCEMCFDNKVSRSKHRKNAHRDLQKHMNQKCPICGKVIVFHLKDHLRLHERDKNGPFQCDICNRRFLKEQSLRVHKGKDHKRNKQIC